MPVTITISFSHNIKVLLSKSDLKSHLLECPDIQENNISNSNTKDFLL